MKKMMRKHKKSRSGDNEPRRSAGDSRLRRRVRFLLLLPRLLKLLARIAMRTRRAS